MSKMARNKGSRGELEILKMLSDELGIDPPLKRNITQTRLDGGADCLELKNWSIEIKRQEAPHIAAWWQQTVEQCEPNTKPILFYRSNYQPWLCMMYLQDINNDYRGDYTVILSFEAACLILRENI